MMPARRVLPTLGEGCEPIAHWNRVLRTAGLPSISYEYAKEALAKLGGERERVPGEDDA